MSLSAAAALPELRRGEDGPEVGAADGEDEAVRLEGLVPAADGDVGEELVDEEVLGQLEEVGLVVAPLQDILLLDSRTFKNNEG